MKIDDLTTKQLWSVADIMKYTGKPESSTYAMCKSKGFPDAHTALGLRGQIQLWLRTAVVKYWRDQQKEKA
jgi:hypothetical protein